MLIQRKSKFLLLRTSVKLRIDPHRFKRIMLSGPMVFLKLKEKSAYF